MFKKMVFLLLSLCVLSNSHAFTCYVTLAKDSCWAHYATSIQVIDAASAKTIAKVSVPQGQSWGRVSFPCQTGQTISFSAKYSPSIWQGDQGTSYASEQYISLPAAVTPGSLAWNIPVCFSRDFSGVSIPPSATNRCACDFKSIPALRLKK